MSDERMTAGMNWIAARLSGLTQGQDVVISPLGWNADTVNVQADRHSLVLLLNGRIQVVTFDDEDLEDLPEDPRLQIQVEGELRALLNDELRGSALPV